MLTKRALAVLAFSLVSMSAYALPIVVSGSGEYNQHYYEVYSFTDDRPSGWNWNDAKSYAEGLSHNGAQGHLVTLTSQGEDDFVWGLKGSASAYLGGYDTSTKDGDGVWHHSQWQWVTGEDFASYQNFFFGEPNNWNDNYTGYQLATTTLDNEDYLMYWSRESERNNGRWNDTNLDSAYVNESGVLGYTTSGFIVEYEPVQRRMVASVPVPPTLWLFVFGFAMQAIAKKGKQKLA